MRKLVKSSVLGIAFQLFAAFILSCAVLVSCKDNTYPDTNSGGSSGGSGGGGSNPTKTERKLTIRVLGEQVQKSTPYIRVCAECEDWVILDVNQDGLTHNESRSFVFLSQSEKIGYYVYATPSISIISQFTDNIDGALENGNVLFVSSEGKYIRYAVVNSLLTNPTILSQTLIESQDDNSSKMPVKNGDYFDDLGASVYRTFSKHFKQGSEEISNSFGLLSWTNLPSVNALTSIWSSYVFAASLHEIYDYNPDLQEELQEDIREDTGFFVKMTLLSSNKYIAYVAQVADVIMGHTIIGEYWDRAGKVEKIEEEEGSDYYYPMFSSSRIVDINYNNIRIIEDEKQEYAIKLRLKSVSETSATFDIDIKDVVGNQAYISYMRLRLEPPSGQAMYTDFYSMSTTLTVSDLMPFTEYYARVEIESMGKQCNSNIISFITKGQLELYPNSLTFPLEGGSRLVALRNISEDMLKSFSVTGPSWCKIEQSATSFFVDVAANKTKRSGTLNVTAILADDSKLTASLPVTQEGSDTGWDGTAWKFSGNVTTSGSGNSVTQYGEIELRVNSIVNNDFSITSAGYELMESNRRISVDENNQLFVEGSMSADGISIQVSLKVVRHTETTATGYYAASTRSGGEVISQSGTLNGVRID